MTTTCPSSLEIAPVRGETLAERLQTVAAWLDTLEGATTDEQRAEIAAAMDVQLKGAAQKVDSFVGLWAQIEMQAKMIAADIEQLQKRKKALDTWGASMRGNAFMALKESGQSMAKGATHAIQIVKTPATLDIFDEGAIPSKYIRHSIAVEIDKEAIKAALTAGKLVPGAAMSTGETVRKR